MNKRKLSAEERKFAVKNLENIEKEIKYIMFDIEHLDLRMKQETAMHEFMLRKGYDAVHKKRKINYDKELFGQKRELKIAQANIETLKDQIQNGVAQKEEK